MTAYTELARLRAENARLKALVGIYQRTVADIETEYDRSTDVGEIVAAGDAKIAALTSPCPGYEIEDGTGDYTGCVAAETGATDCPICGSTDQKYDNKEGR